MMTLHGVDVFLWNNDHPYPDIPKEFGRFTLKLISNRGTKVYPPPTPDIHLLDWPRCRYVSDEVVTDQEIHELLGNLTDAGYQWTKCQKLFRLEGVNQYSEPY